jgi:hypothetical protein
VERIGMAIRVKPLIPQKHNICDLVYHPGKGLGYIKGASEAMRDHYYIVEFFKDGYLIAGATTEFVDTLKAYLERWQNEERDE